MSGVVEPVFWHGALPDTTGEASESSSVFIATSVSEEHSARQRRTRTRDARSFAAAARASSTFNYDVRSRRAEGRGQKSKIRFRNAECETLPFYSQNCRKTELTNPNLEMETAWSNCFC